MTKEKRIPPDDFWKLCATSRPDSISVAFPPDMPEEMVRYTRMQIELASQSDRGVAVIGGAFVDSFLEDAIKANLSDFVLNPKNKLTLFTKLFKEGNPPLGTFSAKTNLAFAMEVIGEHTYKDLEIIRSIRNDFSHKLDTGKMDEALTFSSQSIASRCNNLWLPKNEYYAQRSKKLQKEAQLHLPRGQYTFAVFMICSLIRQQSMLIKSRKESMPGLLGKAVMALDHRQ